MKSLLRARRRMMDLRRLGWCTAVADEATLPADVETGLLMSWSLPFA